MMGNRLFILLIFWVLGQALISQTILKNTRTQVTSPDGKYVFDFYQKQYKNKTKQLFYTISYNGKSVIEESELGILIENRLFESALAIPNDTLSIWCENLSFVKSKYKTINETWRPIYGERNVIQNHYNELTLEFRKGSDEEGNLDNGYDKRHYYDMHVIIRAYNEGVAFRYFFPETENGLFLHIVGEQTQFTLPEQTSAYYERWAQGPYSLLPLKNWSDECERPLTMKLLNGLTVSITEAAMIDYARMKFRLSDTKANSLQASLYSSVDVITPYATPWRVISASEKAIELLENNDIILNLNQENQIEDTSWIKPGKAIRVMNQTWVDIKKCIDFAAEYGLDYIHLDARWYGPEMSINSDATKVAEDKDFNMADLLSYAKQKGIGLWVYVNQRALAQQLDELLPLYKKWGIKGIKFGFVQIGNQYWSSWLHEAVKKCAEYEIMVDIHDEYRPTGFSRTYPNLLTQEGIRGNEEMPDATHNVTLPFTRFLAGPADYTICYYNNRIKTTHAHQLAMAVVYYSPLQFLYWYDTPEMFAGEPELEFWKNVPTVWDDTRVLDGEPGEFIAISRKSGDEWFMGIMTNNDARKLTLSTDFLESGINYEARFYEDNNDVSTRTHVGVKTKRNVRRGDLFIFNLIASGGAAVHFIPQK